MLTIRSPHKYKLALAFFCLLISGCARFGTDDSTQDSSAQDKVIAQLDAALNRVNSQPRWSSSLDDKASFASFATNSVSVSYQGGAADLLRAISAARGMSFKVTGAMPHTPIFVFVAASGEPFEDFIRDLDAQLGQRASIVWRDKGFELRYRQ